MKIGIIGTRGIPNNYGGFEQFAEYLSKGLVDLGHNVSVYNSHSHPYRKRKWNGVDIIFQYDPENSIGTVGQFIYDFNCIRDLNNHSFDIVLQLGYTSSSVWHKLLPKGQLIITNMDGLEWKRAKYSRPVKKFLRYAEKLAAIYSNVLIADSIGIQNHLKETYGKESIYIPYGSDVFENPRQEVLQEYEIEPLKYDMIIARMEPENNIETILAGFERATVDRLILVIGNFTNSYGKYIVNKFNSERIKFLGAIYDKATLNNLRYFSNLYFHGHSVGGTNPSLIEAMGSSSVICAHNNIFNKSILRNDGFYFNDSTEVCNILEKDTSKEDRTRIIRNNLNKIKSEFSWENIISDYNQMFIQSLRESKGTQS